MKPGYQTTEFWTTVPGAAALIETAQQVENPYVQAIAVLGATLIVCWYTWSRTRAKLEA